MSNIDKLTSFSNNSNANNAHQSSNSNGSTVVINSGHLNTLSLQTNGVASNAIPSNTFKNFLLDSNDFEFKKCVQLRFLCPQDIPDLKKLCADWFPVNYPDAWYNDITSSSRFYSLAATYQQRIVGIIVAEIKSKKGTDKEDWHILSRKHADNAQITYILSLGVSKELRRIGIASLLLDTLIEYLEAQTDCKAIYLHVLYSNSVAIKFYEKRKFEKRLYLRNYYTINGQLQDGYCYVLYMNDGQPPWTVSYPLKIFDFFVKRCTMRLRHIE